MPQAGNLLRTSLREIDNAEAYFAVNIMPGQITWAQGSEFVHFAKMANPWVHVARLLVLDGPTRLLREDGSITVRGIGRAEFLEVTDSNGLILVDEFVIQDEFEPVVGMQERPTVQGFLFRNESDIQH